MHTEKKCLVRDKLNGSCVTLTEETHNYLITETENINDEAHLLRFKSNNNETDVFHQLNLIKNILMQSKLKDFGNYNNLRLVSVKELMAHPILPESIWKGLSIAIRMPQSPLKPKAPNVVDFYKKTGTELQFGGVTVFLRGLTNANIWTNQMIHIHVPSLRQLPRPPTEPLEFLQENGKYLIDNPNFMPLFNKENKLKNWCFNIEYNGTKYMLFKPGFNIIQPPLIVYDNNGINIKQLTDLENFIVNFQNTNKSLFINPTKIFFTKFDVIKGFIQNFEMIFNEIKTKHPSNYILKIGYGIKKMMQMPEYRNLDIESKNNFNEQIKIYLPLSVRALFFNDSALIYNPTYDKYLFVSNDILRGDNVVEAHSPRHKNEPRNKFVFEYLPETNEFYIYNPTYDKYLFVSNDIKNGDNVVEAHGPQWKSEPRNKFEFVLFDD